ncbi:Serine/threonine-protein phosphatase [Rhizoctonia solani]|uniref:Serine/threonine-protein phosphatase n=1 Tax=Rhizoctonia solani TaxID=456999 RepID=A0A8H8NLI1_9AGAM|nr:Serine/threonine-protein phosphatase [Rhizoctonia solani]QRW15976.1 Serine/threonine-protein phosphatase [Rhizoctonia solani]
MNGGMHVNGDSDSQAGPSSSSSSSATGRDGPGPDPTLHMDSYSLDELPELIEQQPTIQAEIRTTVSPSELHSLSPHPIPLDTDGRPMHSPDTLDDGLGMAVDAHMGEGEDDWAPAEEWATAEMRRVKVYELKGACWNDRGTGMCSADYDDTTEKAVILVKSEFTDVELLRCEIQAQDVYQRQQGEQGDLGQTLIVWTEPNGTDFALSFQDLDGCGEIWDFIQEVQRHLRGKQDPTSSSPPSTPKVSLERRFAQSFMQAGQIPPPEFNNIGDIDRAIKFLSKNPALKEKICETLVYQKFICSLIELFCEAERSESLQHLHTLCRIMQTIIMLNEHPMYEHMLSDEIFPGVLGMLEYDPEFPDHKASYRHFLSYVAHYREAVPIRDSVVRKKIHQTYRLLFLKDVVLARMLDDPTFNILNSFIIFNQMDIVTHFQHEETILPRMFSAFPRLFTKDGKSSLETHEDPTNIPSDFQPQLNGAGNSSPVIGPMPSPDYSAISSDQDTRRKDIIRMTHQLCSTAKNVQVTTRFALYRLLVDRGVLYAIQWAFSVHNPNPDMVSVQHLCGDILLSVMEYDPHGVRQNILQHSEAGVRTLLEQMIATMGSTKDLALRSQISDALRVLLEVQGAGGDMSVGERSGVSAAAKAAMGRREDPATERFLQYFYEQCIISLYKPVLALPDFTALQGRGCFERTQGAHGTISVLFYICASNIALKLASLLSSREKHVRLAALRVFRACFRTPNQFVTRHLIKQDVVLPIIELTARESRRDNMLSSTCQEFFEYIRRENLRLVIDYMIDKHEARVRELAKHPMVGMRFAGIILRWEQNHEEPPSTESVANSTNGNSTRRWGSGRHMDSEEEDYFNGADDETTEVPLKWAPVQVPPVNQLKRKRARVALGAGARLLGLSGYEDEGEGEEEDEDMNANADGTLGFQNVLSPSPMSVDAVSSPKDSSSSSGSPGSLERERKLTRSAAFIADSPTAARLADMQSDSVGNSDQMDTFPTLLEGGPPPLAQLRAEKRRREEEEDELLALYSNGKRAEGSKASANGPGAGQGPDVEEDTFPLAGKAGAPEGGTKKIKLSLGKGAAAVAAGSPAPSMSPTPTSSSTPPSTDSGGG